MNRIFRRSPADIDEALGRLSDAQKLQYYMLHSKYLATKSSIDALRAMRDQQEPTARTVNANFIRKMMIRFQEESDKALKERTEFENEYMSGLGIHSFSLAGAVTGASAALTAIKTIAGAAQVFVQVAEPLLGIALPKDNKGAFTRTTENTDPVTATGPAFSNVPSGFLESMFTTEALAYLKMHDLADEEDDLKALRDISLIHFFKKTENDVLSARMAATSSGNIVCSAQSNDNVTDIIRGTEEAIQQITLWQPNTIIPWYIIDHSFKSSADAKAVRTAMQTAVAAWNKVCPGGVKFAEVDSEEGAGFTVEFGGPAGAREATGFFPNEYNKGYSDLSIHTAALAEGNRGNLANTLLHQLGHILGFRHNYIVNQERDRKMGNKDVQPNPISVMGLQHPSRINFSDITTTRDIYERFTGEGVYELGKSENGKMLKVQTKRIDTGVTMTPKQNGSCANKQCYCCGAQKSTPISFGQTNQYRAYSVM